MRIRNGAFAGLWLMAAACGGQGGETTTAQAEGEAIGGEMASQTTRPAREEVAETEEEFLRREQELARGEHTMPGEEWTDEGREVTGTGIGEPTPIEGGASAGVTGGISDDITPGGVDDVEDEAMQPGFAQGGAMQPGEEETGEIAALTTENVCPADIEGLNVSVASIPRGGALVFTTSSRDQVQELRDRLNRFVEIHHQQHARAGMEAGMEHGAEAGMEQGSHAGMEQGAQAGMEQGAQAGMEPTGMEQFADAQALIHQASEVRIVEIPRGARLEVRFDDRSQVAELRSELREDAEMLRNGQCPLALQLEG